MALLYRAIFRVDFDQCFALADKPGTIIQTILDTSKNYWEIVGPTSSHYQINAASKVSVAQNRSAENFSVDTGAISGNFEIDEGIPLEDFIRGSYFSVCNEALNAIFERFEIRNINRVGVRLFLTGGVVKDWEINRRKVAARFQALSVPEKLHVNIADIGLVFAGQFEHDTEFRLQCGPGNDSDVVQFFQRPIVEGIEKPRPHRFAADVDIFQKNLNFKGTNLLKWTKAKEPYIRDLLAIAEQVTGGVGDNA